MAYADQYDPFGNLIDPQQNVTSGGMVPPPLPQTPAFSGGLNPASLAPPLHAAAQPIANGQINPVQGGNGYSGGKDLASLVNYWRQNHSATTGPDLPGLIQFLNQNGVQAAQAMHANGTLPSDERITVNGQTYKLGHSLGGSDGFWFQDLNPEGQGGGQSGDGAFTIDPSYLAPFTQQFQAPADAALPSFQAPGAFQAPNAQTLLQDPGYKFREGRITDQIQNSASARGILNSTGTLDDIMKSVGDFAGQEYGNAYNRDFTKWGADWSHALDAYNANFGRANDVYNRAFNEFGLQKDIFQQNQDRPYNKIFQGVDLGARMAGA